MMREDRGQSGNRRDDVATLLRLAGKRRSVPAERTERVKDAARTQWQGVVRVRSRRRYAWTAAAIVTAASLALMIAVRGMRVGSDIPTATGDAAIRIESLHGPAWGRGTADGVVRPLRGGGEVGSVSELTTAADGRVAIRLESGHSVRFDVSTTVRFLGGDSLALDRGAIYVDSGSEAEQRGAPALSVLTPLGLVRELGTQFEVRLEEESVRVRLREGAVVVHHDGQEQEVRAGTELALNPEGSTERREIATHGATWEWIVGITPMPDLEGRTARSFLEWVARERGWTLAFADEAVARSAADTVLGGNIRRLTLDEALDAVLPTCRMTHRLYDNTLLISPTRE